MEALSLPPDRRSDHVHSRTNDPAIREAVVRLLSAHAAGEQRLADAGDQAAALLQPSIDEPPFERIGPWRLKGLLGRGGMGAVYLAERDDGEFEQVAAVKVLPSGSMLESMLQRFRSERGILARLEHPNLARLIDGGVSDAGLPYFVMEYVDGEPIDRWCDRHELDVPARLALFEQVLEVVQYAHRNLIVHRDLKPSNILVTAQGQVKLLDFGIAKVLDAADQAAEATELTHIGGRPLTLAWAAPEQLSDQPVTTATDVHALGLLLYRLLTGCAPYDVPPGDAQALKAAVIARSPLPPSQRVMADDATAAARLRAGSRARLSRLLKGDLDTIMLYALRKEPERRYGSVDQLAEDLSRHRRRLPVSARPESWSYRAGRFVSRHRAGVGVAAAVMAMVLAAVVIIVSQAREVAQERDIAARQAAVAEQVSEFLVELFQAADLVHTRGQTPTALDLARHGQARIDQLDAPPDVRARLLTTLGDVHVSLGEYADSLALYERAVAAWESAGDSHWLDLARTLGLLARARHESGSYDLAEQAARRALELIGQSDPGLRADTLNNLGLILHVTGRHDESEAVLREALALYEGLDPQSPGAASVLVNLGNLDLRGGRPEAAAEKLARGLQIAMRHGGERERSALVAMTSLGVAQYQSGRLEQALDQFQRAHDLEQAVFGEDNTQLAAVRLWLARTHARMENFEYADEWFDRALASARGFGETHPNYGSVLNSMAGLARQRGDYQRADELYHQVLQIYIGAWGEDHPAVAGVLDFRGQARIGLEDPARAKELFERSLEIRRRLHNAPHPDVLQSLHRLTTLAQAQGWVEEAALWLHELEATWQALPPPARNPALNPALLR